MDNYIHEIMKQDKSVYNENGEYYLFADIPVPHLKDGTLSKILDISEFFDDDTNVNNCQLIIRHDEEGYTMFIVVILEEDGENFEAEIYKKTFDADEFPIWIEKIGEFYSWYDEEDGINFYS
jgi:hypothetical protein